MIFNRKKIPKGQAEYKIQANFSRKAGFRSRAGFTLYELLITISVVAIILAIVLVNQTKFKTDIEITNLAYRLALSIREAQVYSISVKEFSSASSQSFDVPYGIHLNWEVSDSYILYADADGNGIYTYPGFVEGDPPREGEDMECGTDAGSECIEKVTLGRGNEITGWCGIWLGSEEEQACYLKYDPDAPGSEVGVSYLDINFKRPNPDAKILSYLENEYEPSGSRPICVDDGATTEWVECSGWTLCLQSPHGKRKEVVVYETGQISVADTNEDSYCPLN